MYVKLLDGSYRRIESYSILKAHLSGSSWYVGDGSSANRLDGTYATEAEAVAALEGLVRTFGVITLAA